MSLLRVSDCVKVLHHTWDCPREKPVYTITRDYLDPEDEGGKVSVMVQEVSLTV